MVAASRETISILPSSSWEYIFLIRTVPSFSTVSSVLLPSSTSCISASIRLRTSGLIRIGTDLSSPSIRENPVSSMEMVLPFVMKYPRFLFVSICDGAVALVPIPCLSMRVSSSASVSRFGGDVWDLVFVIFFTSTDSLTSTPGRVLSLDLSKG